MPTQYLHHPVPLLALLLTVACSSTPKPVQELDGGGGEPDAGGLPPVEISLSETIPAGSEAFRCKYMTLPEGLNDMVRFEHEFTLGSHHILLYPTSLSPEEAAAMSDDFDCTSVGDLRQTGLAYGASDELQGEQEYPPGISLKLASQQVVLLEAHYLNATDSPIQATVTIRMYRALQPTKVAAGNLFFYNPAILIPPEPGTATSAMSCDIPGDIRLQFAASHMHRRGVSFTSSIINSDGMSTVLHQSSDWESPEPEHFAPALAIVNGSRIEFSCDYRNDLPVHVTEGDSAETSEMCMFIASYWPQQSREVEQCIGGSSGPLLHGDATCLETLECLEQTNSDIETQDCLATTCLQSGPNVHSFLLCYEAADCTDDTCVENNCLNEFVVCEASVCGE